MKVNLTLFVPFAFALTACSSAEVRNAWKAKAESTEFRQEKAALKKRLAEREPCVESGLSTFTWEADTPSKGCVYPTSPFVYMEQGQFGVRKKTMEIFQVNPNGFLVRGRREVCRSYGCSEESSPRNIWVHRTDESGKVDGSYLDEESTDALYEWVGPFTYESATGPRTIQSFRKLKWGLANAHAGLKLYRFEDELLAKYEVWSDLETSVQKAPR